MNLHEFQAKQLFADYEIPIASGWAVRQVGDTVDALKHLGGTHWIVKAQIHAGARGKAGGVIKANSLEQAVKAVADLLGKRLVTQQTDALGLPVNTVLIQEALTVERELYLSAVVDRSQQKIVFIASAMGGMDIEAVAAKHPEQILRIAVEPLLGLMPYQSRQLAFALGLTADQQKQFIQIMRGLCRLFVECDATLVEINPLIVSQDGHLKALDAKINLEDSALYRHADLAEWRDETQEDEREYAAQRFGLNYIALDGDIACMVNGAGLAMATMDLIQLHGGQPANFLDVGGGTTKERVAEAFKLILSAPKVNAILVNIFGGIVRCDLIAEGILHAIAETAPQCPVVVRLQGTQVAQGKALLATSPYPLQIADNLTDAAQKAVAAAAQHRRTLV